LTVWLRTASEKLYRRQAISKVQTLESVREDVQKCCEMTRVILRKIGRKNRCENAVKQACSKRSAFE